MTESTTQSLRFQVQSKEQRQFYATLNKRVNRFFKDQQLSKKANTEMIVKTIVFITAYVGGFGLILALQPGWTLALILWAVMGLAISGIGMSIMHDAIHGAYSKNDWVNRLMGYTLNLAGGATINWYWQHNYLHHTYTNITDWDEDIEDKGALKFSPHTKTKWFHKLQQVYAFFFYGLLTLYWVVGKDFVQFFRYTKNGVNKYSRRMTQFIFVQIVALKIAYFAVFFYVPIYLVGIPATQVVVGFLLMHFIAGVVLTVIFQLAHSVEGTDHPMPDEEGNIQNAWAIHEMNTTVNFATGNRLLSWYVGGLNYQVEHHLFPHICHVHYPKIAPIVRETAEEYGVPYMVNDTLKGAIRSHLKLLARYGELPSMDEAIV
jgi:linoleoyl-CoA desaturase